jgi:hypothetical protein
LVPLAEDGGGGSVSPAEDVVVTMLLTEEMILLTMDRFLDPGVICSTGGEG